MAKDTERAIAACAALLLASVTPERLRTASAGMKICAPATAWRDLEAAMEKGYPGFVAHLREAR